MEGVGHVDASRSMGKGGWKALDTWTPRAMADRTRPPHARLPGETAPMGKRTPFAHAAALAAAQYRGDISWRSMAASIVARYWAREPPFDDAVKASAPRWP